MQPDPTSLAPHAPGKVFWGEMSAYEHFMQPDGDLARYLETLERFVCEGIRAGDGTVAILTAAHLHALRERMQAAGLDVPTVVARGDFVAIDAEEMLARFMVGDWPDERRFIRAIEAVLGKASRGARHVRVVGEMVALLWLQGRHGATVRLEHLWGELCRDSSFSLVCAYPKAGFTKQASESIAEICTLHARMVVDTL